MNVNDQVKTKGLNEGKDLARMIFEYIWFTWLKAILYQKTESQIF